MYINVVHLKNLNLNLKPKAASTKMVFAKHDFHVSLYLKPISMQKMVIFI